MKVRDPVFQQFLRGVLEAVDERITKALARMGVVGSKIDGSVIRGIISDAVMAHSDLTGLVAPADDHTQYLREEASGGVAAEVPDHTHAGAAEAGGPLLAANTHASPSTDTHHAKYTDAEAIAAVEGEPTLVLTGDVSVASGKTLSLLTDGSGGGLKLGASGDAHLYRGAANRIDVASGDDISTVAGNFHVQSANTGLESTGANIHLKVNASGSGANLDLIGENQVDLVQGASQTRMVLESGFIDIWNGELRLRTAAPKISTLGAHLLIEPASGYYIRLNSTKSTTGDPTGAEGMIYMNTFDNAIKMYADGAWRTLASW